MNPVLAAPRVVVGMAVLPDRIEPAAEAIRSLLNNSRQPDRIFCVVDLHSRKDDEHLTLAKAFDNDTRVVVMSSIAAHTSKLGDAGKFYVVRQARNCIVLTCDDDLVYPPNYVQTLVDGVMRYQGNAAVGFHGVRISGKLKSYYRSGPAGGKTQIHCLNRWPFDTDVHILGTGVMAFFNDNRFNGLFPGAFGIRNMADIWFGRWAKRHSVPMVCLAHDGRNDKHDVERWLKHNRKVDKRQTIYTVNRWNDKVQTRLVNEYVPWTDFNVAT